MNSRLKLVPGQRRAAQDLATEQALDAAAHFLAAALAKSQTTGKRKPVLLHSIKVALSLLELGFSTDVAVAAVLHDIIERCDVTKARLVGAFSPAIAQLVAAASNDPTIHDPMDRFKDSIARCRKVGPKALALRAADTIDNLERLLASHQIRRLKRSVDKADLLITACREARVMPALVARLVRQRDRGARRLAEQALAR